MSYRCGRQSSLRCLTQSSVVRLSVSEMAGNSRTMRIEAGEVGGGHVWGDRGHIGKVGGHMG